MRTKRNHRRHISGGKRNKRTKSGKKWVTAIEAAQRTLNTTGSLRAAKKTLKKQALTNARKLFGSVGNM